MVITFPFQLELDMSPDAMFIGNLLAILALFIVGIGSMGVGAILWRKEIVSSRLLVIVGGLVACITPFHPFFHDIFWG